MSQSMLRLTLLLSTARRREFMLPSAEHASVEHQRRSARNGLRGKDNFVRDVCSSIWSLWDQNADRCANQPLFPINAGPHSRAGVAEPWPRTAASSRAPRPSADRHCPAAGAPVPREPHGQASAAAGVARARGGGATTGSEGGARAGRAVWAGAWTSGVGAGKPTLPPLACLSPPVSSAPRLRLAQAAPPLSLAAGRRPLRGARAYAGAAPSEYPGSARRRPRILHRPFAGPDRLRGLAGGRLAGGWPGARGRRMALWRGWRAGRLAGCSRSSRARRVALWRGAGGSWAVRGRLAGGSRVNCWAFRRWTCIVIPTASAHNMATHLNFD